MKQKSRCNHKCKRRDDPKFLCTAVLFLLIRSSLLEFSRFRPFCFYTCFLLSLLMFQTLSFFPGFSCLFL